MQFFNYKQNAIINSTFDAGERFSIILFIFLTLYLIWNNKELIRKSKYEAYIRYLMVILLIISQVSYVIWTYMNNDLNKYDIPLHLCNLSLFCGIYVLITKSKKINNIIFFWAVMGAFIGLLTPILTVGFENFRFYQYSLMHVVLVIFPFYMMWVHNYIPTFKSVISSYNTLVFILMPIMIFNTMFGTNFMFINLNRDVRPKTGSLLDLLGPQPLYIFPLLIIGLVLYLLMYIPIHLVYHRKEKNP